MSIVKLYLFKAGKYPLLYLVLRKNKTKNPSRFILYSYKKKNTL